MMLLMEPLIPSISVCVFVCFRISISLLNSTLISCIYFLISFSCFCPLRIHSGDCHFSVSLNIFKIILLNFLTEISFNSLSFEAITEGLIIFIEVNLCWVFFYFLCFFSCSFCIWGHVMSGYWVDFLFLVLETSEESGVKLRQQS